MDELQNDNLTAPATEIPDAPAAESAPPADPFDSGADQFDRAYVERLRGESASYRTKAKPYEDAFGGYTDEDRAVWFEAAKLLADDPKAGGEYLRSVADAVLKQFEDAAVAAPAAPPSGDDQPFTRAEYRAMQEADRAAAVEAANLARIEGEARELGYTDLTSRQYRLLLMTAAELPSGDLKEAHALLEADRDKQVAEYLARKAADADENPTPPAGSGFAPSGEIQIRTFEDARKALEARIAAGK